MAIVAPASSASSCAALAIPYAALPCSITGGFGREPLVAAVREFAKAIEPVPLVEATRKQMRAFVRDQGQVEAGRNPVEQRILKQLAQLRRLTYEAAMAAFVQFRGEALRKNPN